MYIIEYDLYATKYCCNPEKINQPIQNISFMKIVIN
jgi:hypothetical protein